MSTHNIPFQYKKRKKHSKLSKIYNWGIFSEGLNNEFETAVVNESSVFEPSKFYCMYLKLAKWSCNLKKKKKKKKTWKGKGKANHLNDFGNRYCKWALYEQATRQLSLSQHNPKTNEEEMK